MSEVSNISIGSRFARLTVIKLTRKSTSRGKSRAAAFCKCDCGKIVSVLAFSLTGGRTRSCGCLQREASRLSGLTHGHSNTRVFRCWLAMKTRCLNPNSTSYYHYGGRGIGICKRWLKFENFLEDMGYPPENYTLNRINNNGNYSPENCRWATPREQSRNTRRNKIWIINGVSGCIVEHCERFGIRQQVVWLRIKNGWSKLDALKTPVRTCKRQKRDPKKIL